MIFKQTETPHKIWCRICKKYCTFHKLCIAKTLYLNKLHLLITKNTWRQLNCPPLLVDYWRFNVTYKNYVKHLLLNKNKKYCKYWRKIILHALMSVDDDVYSFFYWNKKCITRFNVHRNCFYVIAYYLPIKKHI